MRQTRTPEGTVCGKTCMCKHPKHKYIYCTNIAICLGRQTTHGHLTLHRRLVSACSWTQCSGLKISLYNTSMGSQCPRCMVGTPDVQHTARYGIPPDAEACPGHDVRWLGQKDDGYLRHHMHIQISIPQEHVCACVQIYTDLHVHS